MNRDLVGSIVWAGGIVALSLCASYARQQGYIDNETTQRIVLGATGLMIAWYGNRMPKSFAPSATARQVQRVGGWSLALSGLVYGAVWAFAPFEVALIVGCGAVMLGMAVTLGYCLRLRARAKVA